MDDKLKKYYGKSHAIIIGISEYKEEVSLANAHRDAYALNKVLLEKYGFSNLILFDENATKDKLDEIFVDILSDEDKIGNKDRILVYYSGHGKMKTRLGYEGHPIKEGYIVPYDSKLKRYSSNISMETIVKGCQNCPAKHVLLILDCCYSGYAAVRASEPAKPRKASDRERYLKDISSRRVIQVIAAGQEDEPVSDSGIRPGFSAFTGGFLDVLEGEQDLDDDGILTASEIGVNLKNYVASQHSIYQTPVYSPIAGARGGDFIFKLFHINNP